jgi:hypothetical protein
MFLLGAGHKKIYLGTRKSGPQQNQQQILDPEVPGPEEKIEDLKFSSLTTTDHRQKQIIPSRLRIIDNLSTSTEA